MQLKRLRFKLYVPIIQLTKPALRNLQPTLIVPVLFDQFGLSVPSPFLLPWLLFQSSLTASHCGVCICVCLCV